MLSDAESNNEVAISMAAKPRGTGPLAPLRRRNFTLLFSGQLISLLGDAAYGLALPWTVLAATGDPRQMAVVLAAEQVPRVLLLLVGGVLADRISPRLVMLVADMSRTAVVAVLAVTMFHGLPALGIVALLAALQGAGSGLFQPASQALLPATVVAEELPAANGLFQMLQFLALALGPLLGGIATAAQAGVAFALDAGSFAVSALTLFGIHVPARVQATARQDGAASETAEATAPRRSSMLGDLAAGARYAATVPLLRTLMIVTMFGNFAFVGVANVALIVLARHLSHDPVVLGLILGAMGVGGIIGGLSAGLLGKLRRRGVWSMAGWVLIAIVTALVPAAAGPVAGWPASLSFVLTANQRIIAVAGLMALLTFILALVDTMVLTIMQQRIEPQYLARVFSIQFLFGGIVQPVSLVVVGVVVAEWNVAVAFLGGAVVLLAGALVGAFSRALREL